MRTRRVWLAMTLSGLAALLPCSAFAGNGGNGGGGGHGGRGGSSTLPVILTFRDCRGGYPSADFAWLHPQSTPEGLCPVADDRVKSDDGYPYEDGLDAVQAFIAISGSYGALGLRLDQSARGLFLDFTDCAGGPGTCNPPFDLGIASGGHEGIDVDANVVRQDGLLGMSVGETIATPLRITYGDFGFVNFNPNVKGKDPCKNKSNFVSATRTSATSWEITADANAVACMTLPGGAFGGTYRMPFQFTVTAK